MKKLPEPYDSIVDLPFDDHGWFFNARQLETILSIRKPKTVIEIGSWLGSSTRFIASHLPKNGILYAVDTWRGSQNEAVHMQDPRLPHLYQLFLSNIKHANLTDKIVPIRMESKEAANALNVRADLIYIDGSHDVLSVMEDILSWYPHLNEKGLMCGDDWGAKMVRMAVLHCASQLKLESKHDDNFWWYE